MKSYCLWMTILGVLLTSVLLAQQTEKSRYLEDTLLVNAYLEAGADFLKGQQDSILWATEQALRVAQSPKAQQMAYAGVKQLAIIAGQQLGNFGIQKAGFEQLANFSRQQQNDSLLAVSLYGVAVVQHTLGEHLGAAETLDTITSLLQTTTLSVQQEATILLLSAEIHNALLQRDQAIQIYMQVLRLSERHQLYDKKASSLYGLKQLHQTLGNNKQALDYAQQHLKASQQTQQPARVAVAHLELGTAYIELLEEDITYREQVQDHLNQALQQATAIQYTPVIGIAKLQLGIWQQQQGNLETALQHLQEAVPILEQVQDQGNYLRAQLQLAIINKQLAKQITNEQPRLAQDYWQQVVQFSQSTYEQSQQLGQVEVTLATAQLLAEAQAALGNYPPAYDYLLAYQQMRDSLLNAEKLQIIEETEAQFQNEKKQLQIELLNQEKATRQLWLYGIGIGLVVALLFLGLVAYLYRQKRKDNILLAEQKAFILQQKDLLQQGNQEKELLLKEIHHRVKNNLQIISSLLDLQNKTIQDPQAALAIEDGQSRIRSMALIHNKLYENENLSTINLKLYTQQLLQQILSTLLQTPPSYQINIDPTIELDIDTAIPLGLILNELLTNACKYAFKDNSKGHLFIKSTTLAEGHYQLVIHDNGAGLPTNFDFQKARSLGLRLVRRLSKQLFGKANYAYKNGSQFTISFKDSIRRAAVV